MTLVKICGISEPQHARAAASFGADFVGMVFAPSRRQVTIGQARSISQALGRRDAPPESASTADIQALLRRRRPLLVGVFADQDADTINAIAEQCQLDLIQLSGSEPWELCAHLNRPVFKGLKVRDGQSVEEVLSAIGEGAIVLLDPYVEGAYGGTGRAIDWAVAAQVAGRLPVVLAGGLVPGNVANAIGTVHPWAVDVSSGVESEGVKDVEKIRAFIREVKGASTGRGEEGGKAIA